MDVIFGARWLVMVMMMVVLVVLMLSSGVAGGLVVGVVRVAGYGGDLGAVEARGLLRLLLLLLGAVRVRGWVCWINWGLI
jgi:hypothetical protein